MVSEGRLMGLVVAGAALLAAPFFSGDYILQTLILSLTWATVASNWNLLLGYGGIWVFCQTAFFAVGAYTSALLVVNLGVSPWIGLFAGGAVAALSALALGAATLRLRGIYLALISFNFVFLLQAVIIYFSTYTGGVIGIVQIPALQLFNIRFSIANKLPSYYLILAIFVASSLVTYVLINSRRGMSAAALRDSEQNSLARGIDPLKSRLLTLAVGGFFTGVAGAFTTHYLAVVSVDLLSLNTELEVLAMVVVGGLGMFLGGPLGAFVLTFIDSGLRSSYDQYRLIIYGLITVLAVVLMPKGLAGTLGRIWKPLAFERKLTVLRAEAAKTVGVTSKPLTTPQGGVKIGAIREEEESTA